MTLTLTSIALKHSLVCPGGSPQGSLPRSPLGPEDHRGEGEDVIAEQRKGEGSAGKDSRMGEVVGGKGTEQEKL